MTTVVQVENLEKTYYLGLRRRRVEAVRGVSFNVDAGQIFGFLGPNGAGKTTTIKVLTGLMSPTRGSVQLFGMPSHQPKARRRLGFLPENPYIYPYLTPREFIEMCARLSGLSGSGARAQTSEVLARTGIDYADRPVRRLSKGMLQRVGLAAALVADPELLILDEPMSGLDPIGRKDVRDLIVEERRRGRTVMFSTHILGDVEALCDHVVIMRQGRVVVRGELDALLKSEVERTDIVVVDAGGELEEDLKKRGLGTARLRDRLTIEVEGRRVASSLLSELVASGREVVAVLPRTETLEALFVREAIDQSPQ